MRLPAFTSDQWAALGCLAVAFILLSLLGVVVANPVFTVLGFVVWVVMAVTALAFFRRNRRGKRSAQVDGS